MDQLVSVGSGSDGFVLGPGWFYPEPGGVWSAGSRSFLAMRLNAPTGKAVAFTARVMLFPGQPSRTVDVLFDGQHAATWSVEAAGSLQQVRLQAGDDVMERDILVEFRMREPYDYGRGGSLARGGHRSLTRLGWGRQVHKR